MKVTALLDVSPRTRRVAVGTFDGVHLGHREVIRGSDTVLTFDPHPQAVIHPGAAPRLLSSFAVKRDLMGGVGGVEELVVIPFSREFAALSADAFVEDVLVGALGAERVSVGANFRYGARAQGDADHLRAHDAFETRVVSLVEVDGETVSSSHIRGLIAAGEVARAARFLGAPFLLDGPVVHGDERGRTLGIPTANLVPGEGLACPGHGIYAARAWIVDPERAEGHPAEAGDGYAAAVNVGVRPTFETGRGLLIEAHLLDFDGEIYGQTLRIAFLERLRGERRFESVDALVEQMQRDVERARAVVHSRAPAG